MLKPSVSTSTCNSRERRNVEGLADLQAVNLGRIDGWIVVDDSNTRSTFVVLEKVRRMNEMIESIELIDD